MTDQAEPDTDDYDLFDMVELKRICAVFNIPNTTVILADGTTDLAVDREGMERIRDSMLLFGYIELAQLWEEITEKYWPPHEETP
ncbi:hypothetical protein [Streptomyces microflavus]|uniref:hypothetical protein n=1 Tax=Streptomyces microflavus TaxID=1919 RepID=UPI002E302592|nr:hypothetical protein [Streptomyces microflavus]